MSDTPRTDAALWRFNESKGDVVSADFTRTLERELVATDVFLLAATKAWNETTNEAAKLRNDLATATESLALYRGRSERYEGRMAEMSAELTDLRAAAVQMSTAIEIVLSESWGGHWNFVSPCRKAREAYQATMKDQK